MSVSPPLSALDHSTDFSLCSRYQGATLNTLVIGRKPRQTVLEHPSTIASLSPPLSNYRLAPYLRLVSNTSLWAFDCVLVDVISRRKFFQPLLKTYSSIDSRSASLHVDLYAPAAPDY